jgi:tRNA-specific 2-thiouridylase
MARVIVALSGGVDSSVAAALLSREGHRVTGVTMRIWDGGPAAGTARHACYGPDGSDIEDAARLCRMLGVPFHVFDLREQFRAEVLDYVRREYLSGRTPNPCVRCNRLLKLGLLVDMARENGIPFDYVATGHYARVERSASGGRSLLEKASDAAKDQSYFLFALSQEQLGHALFPIGGYTKKHVKKLASDMGLDVADKPESQDFAAGSYASILGMPQREGPILDRQGKVLGTHRGMQHYTIGQRKGLGLSARDAMYVTAIDARSNAVVVGAKEEVYSDALTCSALNWIDAPSLSEPRQVTARIRYNHREAEATITPVGADSVHVRFREPQMAIAPGQAVVFYDGNVVVGGGTIDQ